MAQPRPLEIHPTQHVNLNDESYHFPPVKDALPTRHCGLVSYSNMGLDDDWLAHGLLGLLREVDLPGANEVPLRVNEGRPVEVDPPIAGAGAARRVRPARDLPPKRTGLRSAPYAGTQLGETK